MENSSVRAQGYQLYECVQNFLYQHAHAPIRGGNTMDLNFSTEQHTVENVEVFESFDRDSVELSVIMQVKLEESMESEPDFRRAYFQAFRSYVSAFEWHESLIGKSVEDQWQGFS